MRSPFSWLIVVVTIICLGLADGGLARAQQPPPMMKLDLVVTAGIEEDARQTSTGFCAVLPDEATTLIVTRRAYVPETGTMRPLWMTVRPFVSTAYPLVDRANVQGVVTLFIPELGHGTCFHFDYTVPQAQAQGVAQSYKHFGQVVTIEVR